MASTLREIEASGFEIPVDISDAQPQSKAVGLTRQELAEREDAPTASRRRGKPAWWLLYVSLPLTAFVFGVADMVPATSGWRSLSELVSTLVIFLGIGLWLHANRLALMLAEYEEQSESTGILWKAE